MYLSFTVSSKVDRYAPYAALITVRIASNTENRKPISLRVPTNILVANINIKLP